MTQAQREREWITTHKLKYEYSKLVSELFYFLESDFFLHFPQGREPRNVNDVLNETSSERSPHGSVPASYTEYSKLVSKLFFGV